MENSAISTKDKERICVIGAGYVGLPYAIILTYHGYKVTVYDIDKSKIQHLQLGNIPFFDRSIESFIKHKRDLLKRIDFTYRTEDIYNCNVFIISIGTFISGKYSDEDLLSFFRDFRFLSRNKICFIVKSTVKPGTTRRIKEMLEGKGAKYGKDFLLIYNPEFLREGSSIEDILNPNKIVAGLNYEEERKIIEDLYSFVSSSVPRIFTNWETAELIKIAQNTFLAMKISFANDLMYIAKKHGLPIDFKALAKALGLDPRIGEYGLYPGLGFGGSCLPKDSKILAELEKDTGYKLIQEVVRINDENVDKIIEIIEEKYGKIKDKRILIVGLSFKEGVDDLRGSKALELAIKLKAMGNDVYWYDEDIKEERDIHGIKPGRLEDKYDLILITKNKPAK